MGEREMGEREMGEGNKRHIPMGVSLGGEGNSPNLMRDIIHARILLGSYEGSFVRITAYIQDRMGGDDHRLCLRGTGKTMEEAEAEDPKYEGRLYIRSFPVKAVALLYLKALEERRNLGDRVETYSKPEYWYPEDPAASRKRIRKYLDSAWDSKVEYHKRMGIPE